MGDRAREAVLSIQEEIKRDLAKERELRERREEVGIIQSWRQVRKLIWLLCEDSCEQKVHLVI